MGTKLKKPTTTPQPDIEQERHMFKRRKRKQLLEEQEKILKEALEELSFPRHRDNDQQ